MSNIFSNISNINTAREKYNISQGRPDIIDTDIAKELNSYRFWGQFQLRPEPINNPGKRSDGTIEQPELISMIGTKSLFNNVNAVPYNTTYQISNNAPLLDSQELRQEIRRRGDCSIRELVRASREGELGRAIYNYSDFMYCKYLGRTSNNYLITLRRFPYPVGDHINYITTKDKNERIVKQPMPDIGRMVTWMSTPGNSMSNILKYSVLMPYKKMDANIQDLNNTAETGGILGSIMNMASPSYISSVVKGGGGDTSIGVIKSLVSPFMPKSVAGSIANTNTTNYNDWAYHRDESKPYGPVDVITSTHIRRGGAEGGLEFNQEISLTFDYELRSYDNINTKAAFLDLIGNILAVTYTNGKFWGGGYRATGPSQSNAFTNLALWKLGANGKKVTLSSLGDSVLETISQIGAAFNNGQPITGKGGLQSAIKNLSDSIGNLLLGGALNALGRPQKQALNSLLTPAPVGLWHLMIGNPKHPIMSMGNMILTGVDISHYGPLGLDDFPTGLKVEIKLIHAKPRDAQEIEHLYNMGDYRIYHPMGKYILNMYENATPYKRSIKSITNNTKNVESTKDSKDNSEVVSTTEQKSLSEDTQKTLMKFFGDTNQERIIWAGDEGFMGSQKAITEEESKKNQEILNRTLNNDSTK